MHRIIVLAIPIFALLMLVEFVFGWRRGRNTYRLNDAIGSLSQGLLSQALAVCTQLLQIGLYVLIQPHIQLVRDASIWDGVLGWLLAIVLYDLCDYWLHRVSHESAIFWAAHVVHHQSQCLNLSTALRQESAYLVLGWMFYLPLALLGVPPDQFAVAGLVVLVYQFWIHTEHIGKLGWFDRVFSSPSNHRVHHAVNDRYIDRNYGAILVLWDRLFGTFQEEGEPCVYGTRRPLRSLDPLWAVAMEYHALWLKARQAPGWRGKLQALFGAPGWEPAGPGTAVPAATFDLQAVQTFDPPMTRAQSTASVLVFLACVGACCRFLWMADEMGPAAMWAAALGTAGGLWSVGALMAGRLCWPQGTALGLLAAGAVLATVAASA